MECCNFSVFCTYLVLKSLLIVSTELAPEFRHKSHQYLSLLIGVNEGVVLLKLVPVLARLQHLQQKRCNFVPDLHSRLDLLQDKFCTGPTKTLKFKSRNYGLVPELIRS